MSPPETLVPATAATPIGVGYISANVGLRKKLDLFADVRPVHSRNPTGMIFSTVMMLRHLKETAGID